MRHCRPGMLRLTGPHHEQVLMRIPSPAAPPACRAATPAHLGALGRGSRGQSVVEFTLILGPLMVLILGIIQLGLVFNAYVTVANATREGARTASIYVYDRTMTKTQNDTARSAAVISAVRQSMGFLPKNAPNLADSDIVTTYSIPTGVNDSDARVGQHVGVRVGYHLDLLIPLIAQLMPRDANGRMTVEGQVTMVVN
jgi:Flp pilus assembly protein TadG